MHLLHADQKSANRQTEDLPNLTRPKNSLFRSHKRILFGKKSSRTRRGETLVEVLGAFFVLSIISTAATLFITQSNRTAKLVEDRMIANNLASDAIETILMFRNTNWMKFADKDECWDVRETATECPAPDADKMVPLIGGPENYKLVLNPNTLQSSLEKCNSSLDLASPSQQNDNKCYGLHPSKAPNENLLVNYLNQKGPPPKDPRFYRMITLTRLDQDAIKIDAKVQWKSINVHTVNLSHILTNY